MTAATEIAASGPLRRPAWLTDDTVRKTVVVLAALAVPIGFALHQFIRPFPWLGAGLIFFLAAATRTFGIPLPGKGFASFTVGPAMAGVAALGWAAGGLLVGLGVFAGDLAVRRLPLRNAVGNASHFITASCVAGTVYYSVASGGIGAGALGAWNTWRLALFIVMFLIVANSTFYLQLRLSPAIAWVDARLTLRWETAVAVMATLLTIAGMHLAYTPAFSRWYLVEALTLAGLVVFAHWLVRRGAMGDSLELVQRLTRLISARAETREALRDIEGLTRSLVPWEEMRIAAYDAAADELVIVASTSPDVPSGARLSAREGLAGLALRTGRPVTTRDADRLLRRTLSVAGSEVALPLKHGSRLVGLWSVRHSRTDMYREYDASLLEPVAPQLALALALDALIQPVLSATEHMGRHVDSVTATTEQLHASAQETAGTARRLAATVRTMSQTLAKTVEEARTTQAIADGTVTEGQDTQQSGAEMLSDARAVREATVSGAAQLTAAADTVMATAEEVSRLQAVSSAVQRFGQTITALADQTGLLALNAAIEAARAGAHGSGFAVVAQEIRALADRSAEEADGMNRAVRDIGALLERATALMERTRADVLGVAEASGTWVSGLDRIVAAAERVVAAGDRIVSAARGSARRSAIMERALTSAQEDVSNAAAETDVVAGASTQQESAIGALNDAATQLSLTAEELLAAVSAVREVGSDARTAEATTPAPGYASASAAPDRAGSQ